MAKKAIMTKGGLDKALQKLAQKGDWDKAHVERFRGRVRDHVRGKREPDEKAKTRKETRSPSRLEEHAGPRGELRSPRAGEAFGSAGSSSATKAVAVDDEKGAKRRRKGDD